MVWQTGPYRNDTMASPLPICELFGFPISAATAEQTLEVIDRIVQSGEPSMVVTADSYGLMIALQDQELATIYRGAALLTPDSSGVVWALRRKGINVKRVSGVDLVEKICGLSAQKEHRIVFVGSATGVAELAAENLRMKHPGCSIVWTRDGYFSEPDDMKIAQEIATHRPDVLLVAMGIPRQEKFIANTLKVTGAKIAMGVGGSFDVYSGKVKRAPKWIQAIELEWLWRLILNPKKFYKVARLPKFAWMVLRGKS